MVTWKRRLLVLALALMSVGTYVVVRPNDEPQHFSAVAARVRKRTTTTRMASTTTTAQPTTTSEPTATTSKPATATTQPASSACAVFPADNAWNTDISAYPLNPNSARPAVKRAASRLLDLS